MTIYLTPFDAGTGQCTGPSADSGFASFDEVVAAFGTGYTSRGPRTVIYPGMMFSDYKLSTGN